MVDYNVYRKNVLYNDKSRIANKGIDCRNKEDVRYNRNGRVSSTNYIGHYNGHVRYNDDGNDIINNDMATDKTHPYRRHNNDKNIRPTSIDNKVRVNTSIQQCIKIIAETVVKSRIVARFNFIKN
jgi:hypothetical protein